MGQYISITSFGRSLVASSDAAAARTALGAAALVSPTFTGAPSAPNPAGATGTENEMFGAGAGGALTTGSYNAFFGELAGSHITTGQLNSACGRLAMRDMTTGSSNTALGANAMLGVTVGANNLAIGIECLHGTSLTTGNFNVAIGQETIGMGNATTLAGNVAIGYRALYGNSSGSYNKAIGYGVLMANTTGSENIGGGHNALSANTTGNGNVGIGGYDGVLTCAQTLTTGSYNTIVGPGTDVAAAATTSAVALGRAAVAASNELALSPYVNVQTFYGLSSTSATRARADFMLANVDNTDATRKYRFIINAWDTAAREGFRVEADGASPRIGFYGVAAIARAVLATGAGRTVDDIITALQNLGLVKQS